jgi:hypothetical protein
MSLDSRGIADPLQVRTASDFRSPEDVGGADADCVTQSLCDALEALQ